MRSESEYIYYSPNDNSPVLKVKRVDQAGRKDFYQQRYVDGEWVSGGATKEITPYKYIEWKDTYETVFLVEGEKCADILISNGLYATTTPGGANGWKNHYAKYFKGKNISILPDNDNPGKLYATNALGDLKIVAKTIKLIELPGLDSGEDVFNYIEKFGINSFNDIVSNTVKLAFATHGEDEIKNEDLYPVEELPPLIKKAIKLFSVESDGSPVGVATALFAVIGSLVGKSYKFQNNFINNYYVLVGSSGYSRKTTIQKFAKRILDSALNSRSDLTSEHLNPEELVPEQFTSVIDVTSFSVEGLQEIIVSDGVSILLMPTEYKSILDVSKRQSQSNTISDLTGLYDCTAFSLTLRGKQLRAKDFSINMLACSTKEWLVDLFSSQNVSGGFLNRHLVGHCAINKTLNAVVGTIEQKEINELVQDILKIVPVRKIIFNGSKHEIVYETKILDFENAEARNCFSEYISQSHKEALAQENIFNPQKDLNARESLHIIKLAALHSICSGKMCVGIEAIQFAIKWAQASSRIIININETFSKRKLPLTNKNDEKILALIKKHYINTKSPMLLSEISKKTGGKQMNNRISLTRLLNDKKIKQFNKGYVPVHPYP